MTTLLEAQLKQEDSIGTGTTSDADCACQGGETFFFSDHRGLLPAWVHSNHGLSPLTKGLPWVQAR